MSAARRAKHARAGKALNPGNGSPQPVAQVLGLSEPLARLALRLRDSNERFRAIEADLPPLLRPHVKPGPIDALTAHLDIFPTFAELAGAKVPEATASP